MYNAEYTRSFYNAYGAIEWERLETRAFGRLQAVIHEDFIRRYLEPGDRVLDAGAGPGRFSMVAAGGGAKVTVLDISDKQLELAQQKINEAGLTGQIEKYVRGDICDLSVFPDASFDMVICFGGALSYVCERRQQAANELIRVAKPGGAILVSVMSRLGVGIGQLPEVYLAKLQNLRKDMPGNPALWPVIETGDLPFFPSPRTGMMHAAMHMYTSGELANLFRDCKKMEIAASNVTLKEWWQGYEIIASDPEAWANLVEMEKKLNHEPGLLDTGSHIIMTAIKE
jgi:ubiquinone/menaquinone biosynthesis C-methylase UbiE